MHHKTELPKYKKQNVAYFKGETDTSDITAGGFNIQIQIVNRTTRKNIRKERNNLNNT